TGRSADAGMSFGKVKDKMTTDRSKPENAGSLELSRVAWPGIPVIGAEHLSHAILDQSSSGKSLGATIEVTIFEEAPLDEAVADLERQLITRALTKHNGNLTHTARSLKLTNKGLRDKMRRLGIERPSPNFSTG
ncbi:MAG: helix-turn-helix domain-containing protein, partial [Blastocatellales bacterium]